MPTQVPATLGLVMYTKRFALASFTPWSARSTWEARIGRHGCFFFAPDTSLWQEFWRTQTSLSLPGCFRRRRCQARNHQIDSDDPHQADHLAFHPSVSLAHCLPYLPAPARQPCAAHVLQPEHVSHSGRSHLQLTATSVRASSVSSCYRCPWSISSDEPFMELVLRRLGYS